MIAVRGATTITENSIQEIKNASIELIDEIIKVNKIELVNITALIFSCTTDITKDYPGKFVREYFNLGNSAIMHFNEMFVENSMPLCIRVLVLLDNGNKKDVKYVYLREAKKLRNDLFNIN